MGTNYSVGGSIRFDPPLDAQARENVYRQFGWLQFVFPPNGPHLAQTSCDPIGVDVEHDRIGDVADFASELQDVVDALPGHTITGRFDIEGADAGDMWRIKVTGPDDDRVVVVYQPTITWPEGSE